MAATLHLALDDSKPRGRALEAALRAAIRDGRLSAGTQLPPSRALADDLGFSRATVVETYSQLQAEGYLVSRQGAGTWVAALPLLVNRPPVVARAQSSVRYDFNPGLPDLTAFPRAAWASALRRGLREAAAADLGFQQNAGSLALRQRLAAYLTRARGVVAEPSLIHVCGGTNHALALLGRVLFAKGLRRIAMEDPCLGLHRRVIANTGLEIVALPTDEHGARTDLLPGLGVDAVVLTPAHHFPLGVALAPERRSAAIEWARSHDCLVIEDDYDAELRYDRAPVGALQALDVDRVVYIGTASKTLGPGLRLGWMVIPPELAEPVASLRELEDMHTPATEQLAFAEFLGSGEFERHVRRLRGRYRKRRNRILRVLAERVPVVRPVGISAGLRILLELPQGSPSSVAIAERAHSRSVSLFSVASTYHSGLPPAGRDGLVVGYSALPEHAFERGITVLADLLARELG